MADSEDVDFDNYSEGPFDSKIESLFEWLKTAFEKEWATFSAGDGFRSR